jgi:hypothetical protein
MRALKNTLCLALIVSCMWVCHARAGWIDNGTPLTLQRGSIEPGAIAADGSSGVILVFEACEKGLGRVIAQRLGAAGVALWGEEGISVCKAEGDQQYPRIVGDGEGGAVIAWYDTRAAGPGIYVQRIDASGVAQWAGGGVRLLATGASTIPVMASDGAGGAIVAWSSWRGVSRYDIHAQRVDASGGTVWTEGGVAVCTAAGDQDQVQVASDDGGGAIVAWKDARGPSPGIYAQRVSGAGTVEWAEDGVPLCTESGGQWRPQIIRDGAGGALVAWEDYRTGIPGAYAQRVNASGEIRWTANGVDLCTDPSDEFAPELVSDGAEGAVFAWGDYRTGDWNIYAQRVDGAGSVRWAPEGVSLCTATGEQYGLQMVADNAGGAIVAWTDTRSIGGDNLYAQRVNASGAVQWTRDGVVLCAAPGDQSLSAAVSDGAGGQIAAWWDTRSGGQGVYAQRLNASGTVQWETDGVLAGPATGDEENPVTVSDGEGGAVVVWKDSRNGGFDVYAQRIGPSGNTLWTQVGAPVCTAEGDQERPEVAPDFGGGAIVAWKDKRAGDYDIFAQRLDGSGAPVWRIDGVALSDAMRTQANPVIVSDGAGGAIIAWEDNRSENLDYDIYAQRVSSSGTVQWTPDGVPLCTAPGDQYGARVTSDGVGGAIVTWVDYRTGADYHVYAQRVNGVGEVQWKADGLPLCSSTGNEEGPQIVSDGAGGAIVAWYDFRNMSDYDIYAQRVSESGELLWTESGVALCTAADYQYDSRIASDGEGGAIVVWYDFRAGIDWDVYAQRVDASGAIQWPADGISLSVATGDQVGPEIASDGAGGAIVAWHDERDMSPDIYAQRVNGSGESLWKEDGVPVCTASGAQIDPRVIGDGVGGAIVAWDDERCGKLVYAQRIRSSGEIVGTFVETYSAALEGRSIRIVWSVSEIGDGVRFSVLRASGPDWEYEKLEGGGLTRDRMLFSFTDAGCLPGTSYRYRVECEGEGMPRRLLFETEAIVVPPLPLTLYQNRPNPFNPSTVIRFYVPETGQITLDVYDVAGERVVRLAEGKREKGFYEVTWDGRNSLGVACASGVYFSRLKAGKSVVSRKMVIAR